MSGISAKGWNWGEYKVTDSHLGFMVDSKPSFSVNLRDIAHCSAPGKNEVAFEFQMKESVEEDFLCEMRIFIPDQDATVNLTKELSERNAFIGQESLVTLYDLPMLVPRGKYSLDMFQSYMRLHGKTHNYKILYKNLTKVFLLPKPDGIHINMVIGLDSPIKQGNTFYPFIVIQFSKDSEESVSVKMSQDELQTQFGGEISQNMEGKSFDIVSRLIKAFTKALIIIPGNFRSKGDLSAVKCSVRASEGHLYPLQKSFIFIPKPVIYIKFEDIRYVEFARITEDSVTTNRTFDLNIYSKSGTFQFTGVEREEYSGLLEFLVKKKISIRKTEEEVKEKEDSEDQMDLDDEDDEEEDGSFNESDLE